MTILITGRDSRLSSVVHEVAVVLLRSAAQCVTRSVAFVPCIPPRSRNHLPRPPLRRPRKEGETLARKGWSPPSRAVHPLVSVARVLRYYLGSGGGNPVRLAQLRHDVALKPGCRTHGCCRTAPVPPSGLALSRGVDCRAASCGHCKIKTPFTVTSPFQRQTWSRAKTTARSACPFRFKSMMSH